MGVLDALIYGVRDVFDRLGAELPRRSRIKFAPPTGAQVPGDVIDDQLHDLITVIVGGGGGVSSSGVSYEIPIVGGIFTTIMSGYDRAGARIIDLSPYPATDGTKTRTIKFAATMQKTSSAAAVQCRLRDVTHSSDITGTALSYSTDQAVTEVVSGALTVGSSAGNLRSDVASMYEASVRMSGGVANVDTVYLLNARLIISYA